MMQSAGFRASMSHMADCYDNAPMESFIPPQNRLVHHQFMQHVRKPDVISWLASKDFKNRTRRHSAIGYLSPIEMELKAA